MTCREMGLNTWVCGPSSWVEFEREPAGDLWCFGCRKRLPHDWVLAGEDGFSWYEPTWARECSRCHDDRTHFPGCGPL